MMLHCLGNNEYKTEYYQKQPYEERGIYVHEEGVHKPKATACCDDVFLTMVININI